MAQYTKYKLSKLGKTGSEGHTETEAEIQNPRRKRRMQPMGPTSTRPQSHVRKA